MDEKLVEARRLMCTIPGPGMSIEEACKEAGTNRMAYHRWKESLSPADREMEELKPGYFRFHDMKGKYLPEVEKECANCSEPKNPTPFKTRLLSNRFCSIACRPRINIDGG